MASIDARKRLTQSEEVLPEEAGLDPRKKPRKNVSHRKHLFLMVTITFPQLFYS